MRYLCIRPKVGPGLRPGPDGGVPEREKIRATTRVLRGRSASDGGREEDEDRVPEGMRHGPRLLGLSALTLLSFF